MTVECYNGCFEDSRFSYTEVVGRDVHFGIHAALVLCPSCILEKVISKLQMILLSDKG